MYFDRIDVSEEIDVSKAIASTECGSWIIILNFYQMSAIDVMIY